MVKYIPAQWCDRWKMGLWHRGAEEQRAISAKKERVDIWMSTDERILAKKERVDIRRSTNEQIPNQKGKS